MAWERAFSVLVCQLAAQLEQALQKVKFFTLNPGFLFVLYKLRYNPWSIVVLDVWRSACVSSVPGCYASADVDKDQNRATEGM